MTAMCDESTRALLLQWQAEVAGLVQETEVCTWRLYR